MRFMKKIKYILSAFMAALCLQSFASNERAMVINMMNANNDIYITLTDNPTILVNGDLLEVTSANYVIANINKNAVRDIHYEESIPSEIKDMTAADLQVSPRVTHDYIVIKGLPENSQVRLYGLKGDSCPMSIKHLGSSTAVDMSTLANGMYLLDINGHTFKITKK